MKNFLITGGCGFIGSNFINYIHSTYPDAFIVNVDKLDYCANINNVYEREDHSSARAVVVKRTACAVVWRWMNRSSCISLSACVLRTST